MNKIEKKDYWLRLIELIGSHLQKYNIQKREINFVDFSFL